MWLLVFFEYFKTSSRRAIIFNALISGIICCGMFYVPEKTLLTTFINQFLNNSVSVLSLLVGFTVAMFTLLITASNPNIEEIKTIDTEYSLYKAPVSIFKILLIRTVYIILVESILLIMNLVYPFLLNPATLLGRVFFGVNAFLLTHIILTNINNTVDLYFILTKKDR